MVLNDSLAEALSNINNAEKVSKPVINVSHVSKLLKNVLEILKDKRYVGSYDVVPSNGGEKITLNLLGSINKCGVIKPRFSFELNEIEKIEKKYLPAKNFGVVIVSTSMGLMTISEARENKIGGKLIAYCY